MDKKNTLLSRDAVVQEITPFLQRKGAVYYIWLTVWVLLLLMLTAGLFLLYDLHARPYLAHERHLIARGFFARDKLLGWRLRPGVEIYTNNSSGETTGLFFSTNCYGFRGDSSDLPAEGEAILLGDSFAQGYFLSNRESISEQLAQRLNSFVYNFGVGGYSTDQEYLVLKYALRTFRVKYVIVMFFINDLLYLSSDMAWDLPKPRFEVVDKQINFNQVFCQHIPVEKNYFDGDQPVFSSQSAACEITDKKVVAVPEYNDFKYRLIARLNFYKHIITSRKPSPRPGLGPELEFEQNVYLDAARLDAKWDLAFQFFTRMQEMAGRHGARLTVFFVPERKQLTMYREKKKWLLAPQKRFAELCRAHQIDYIDPVEEYLQADNFDSLFWIEDNHFSPYGAALTADIIQRHLKALEINPDNS